MHLESEIVIHCLPEQVRTFLGDIANVPKWDLGVAAVRQTSESAAGIGLEFDTLGHTDRVNDGQERGRMSYRVVEPEPNYHYTVQLTSTTGNARYFKTAKWNFRMEPVAEGTRVVCSSDFKLRLRYIILAPILYAMKSAIRADLESLKRAVESN